MSDFEKMLRGMFSSIWDCEIDHPLWQDTVGEIMTAVIQTHEKCMPEPCEDAVLRQAAIDALNVGAELLKRVLDDVDVIGVERAKYEWGLNLIESYIFDVKELPPIQPEPQWISVNKRLPKESCEAFCTCSSDGSGKRWTQNLYFDAEDHKNWCYFDGELYPFKVHAWLPKSLFEPFNG